MLRHIEMTSGKGTWQVNGNSTRRVRIEAAGEGVVAHVGLHALGAFADRLGVVSGRRCRPGSGRRANGCRCMTGARC